MSYLDPSATRSVRSIQKELSDLTGSLASLTTWEPHVTIGDGVEVEPENLDKFLETIRNISSDTNSFQLELRDIGTMDDWVGGEGETFTPYVIYLDVKINDNLMNIVSKLNGATNKEKKWYLMPRPFRPHCTLAFRDLTEEGYEKGIKYLNKLDLSISTLIDHIALVEMLPEHDRELIRFDLAK